MNLAESAQILQRLVQYEIPALKKQIAKNDQAVVVGFFLTSYVSLQFSILFLPKLCMLFISGHGQEGERLFEAVRGWKEGLRERAREHGIEGLNFSTVTCKRIS